MSAASMMPAMVMSPAIPVTINAPSGELFALLHEPARVNFEQCIIMLNSGMMNRVGPQRLYQKFAQEACIAGIAVIRVDLAGVGDSDAETGETHFDNHRKEDVNAIIEYAASRWPQAKIFLQGLCAGARVSFKAASINADVEGLLAWSTEIFTASQNMPQSPLEPEDRLSNFDVENTLARAFYFFITFKFLNANWWRQQYPDGKGVREEVVYTIKCALKAVTPFRQQTKGEFLEAADKYLASNRKVLFLYGEYDDRAYNEFQTRFPQIRNIVNSKQGYAVINKATHTFSSADSQKQLITLSIDWLQQQITSQSKVSRSDYVIEAGRG